jgi:hypothetical protein
MVEEINYSKLTFVELQNMCHQTYIDKGFAKEWEDASKLLKENGFGRIADLAELGLVCEEVGEGMSAIRHNDEKNELEEDADIIIRVMTKNKRMGRNLVKAIYDKNQYNMTRPKLHGKTI